ncbi:hypothetical protein M885DRAFT_617698 [Pelagophyceae sp. CCMP2097]|nr:hypothetical protein M885DRAFT_617698 [Pelagophyceae sp. CCMP2097]
MSAPPRTFHEPTDVEMAQHFAFLYGQPMNNITPGEEPGTVHVAAVDTDNDDDAPQPKPEPPQLAVDDEYLLRAVHLNRLFRVTPQYADTPSRVCVVLEIAFQSMYTKLEYHNLGAARPVGVRYGRWGDGDATIMLDERLCGRRPCWRCCDEAYFIPVHSPRIATQKASLQRAVPYQLLGRVDFDEWRRFVDDMYGVATRPKMNVALRRCKDRAWAVCDWARKRRARKVVDGWQKVLASKGITLGFKQSCGEWDRAVTGDIQGFNEGFVNEGYPRVRDVARYWVLDVARETPRGFSAETCLVEMPEALVEGAYFEARLQPSKASCAAVRTLVQVCVAHRSFHVPLYYDAAIQPDETKQEDPKADNEAPDVSGWIPSSFVNQVEPRPQPSSPTQQPAPF